ncbi:3'-5' exoribonuclease domain-containing protein [Paenarthrobacter sp. A20]|uniref:3'-5' exoribonuclease domain-containing protein n=1 Tax=Paenarthrobacter sp. A20 TaxID=2817891 RepID=UPI00209E0708|nr:3'-5' exoribonuclease [Paenarthrobacter sp. A20]MCP1414397.1 hypothetical protein [Paenarthrobacter sp. A20]
MRYFYDTEFHEDGTTIDLISIGIVAEDGREYYAVNLDADWERIKKHSWLMENVASQLPDLSRPEWKTKSRIADDVAAFLLHDGKPELWADYCAYDHVVLAQLFGTMMNLPSGIPMFTHDLRSFLDWFPPRAPLPAQESGQHDALADARHVKLTFEALTRA